MRSGRARAIRLDRAWWTTEPVQSLIEVLRQWPTVTNEMPKRTGIWGRVLRVAGEIAYGNPGEHSEEKDEYRSQPDFRDADERFLGSARDRGL